MMKPWHRQWSPVKAAFRGIFVSGFLFLVRNDSAPSEKRQKALFDLTNHERGRQYLRRLYRGEEPAPVEYRPGVVTLRLREGEAFTDPYVPSQRARLEVPVGQVEERFSAGDDLEDLKALTFTMLPCDRVCSDQSIRSKAFDRIAIKMRERPDAERVEWFDKVLQRGGRPNTGNCSLAIDMLDTGRGVVHQRAKAWLLSVYADESFQTSSLGRAVREVLIQHRYLQEDNGFNR